jgi:hypothetical protein
VAGSAESSSARIEVRGCRVSVESGALLRSLGTGAENQILGRSTIVVAGTMEATSANVLSLPVGFSPIVSGDVIPPPRVVNDPDIVACEAAPSPTPTLPPGVTATATPSRTPSPSPTSAFTPTPTPITEPPCAGDCDEEGGVTLAEVIMGVNIALDIEPRDRCPSLDSDASQTIEVHELVTTVANLLDGCP